jgi:hypothetical protein
MIEIATNLTVSVVIALSAFFSDGVDLMEKKDYGKADKAFTRVITDKDAAGIYLAPALLLRARCRLELKKKDQAQKDVEQLFTVEGSQKLWKPAVEVYEKAGGKVKALMPKTKPTDVWDSFMAAMRKGEVKKAIKYTHGGFVGVVKGSAKSEEFVDIIDWLDENPFQGGDVTNMLADSATMFSKGGGAPGLTVSFVRHSNEWKISGMYPRFQGMGGRKRRAGHNQAVQVVDVEVLEFDTGNRASVEALLEAISEYVWEQETVPPSFEAMIKSGDLDGKSGTLWRHPLTGKQLPYIYMMKVVPQPDKLALAYLKVEEVRVGDDLFAVAPVRTTEVDAASPILIAAPMAVKGKRDIGTAAGWMAIDEKKFAKMAITLNWKIDGVAKSLKASGDVAKEVAKLVEQMRKGVSSKRKAARNELIEMGVSALTELKKYEADPDPEIKESVKDIIKKLE